MMEHFHIDGLAGYQLDFVDKTSKAVNPAYRRLEGEIERQAGKKGRKFAQFHGELQGTVSLHLLPQVLQDATSHAASISEPVYPRTDDRTETGKDVTLAKRRFVLTKLTLQPKVSKTSGVGPLCGPYTFP
jgi:hypothetical protein